ncbi:MAG: histidinol-phosphate transaminase [Chloroflexota bacterium]
MSEEKDIARRVRPDLAALTAYAAHKSPDTLKGVTARKIIKLDANENPYGCSPRARLALAEYGNWHIYPDAAQTRLRGQLAEYTGTSPERIVAATGSGELLDDILVLLLGPGDEVINCPPTFDLYRLRTIINGGKLVNIERDADFNVDVPTVRAAVSEKTKLIVLSNPNNPTGNATPEKDIIALAETGVPLLVDEAYIEFTGESVVPLTAAYPNIMVLRTFSKWAGLAGLRIGYGIFPAAIAAYLLKIKLPYNVNVAALVAAEASLQDAAFLMDKVKDIIAERARLFRELGKVPWLKAYPSRANFIYCRLTRGKADRLYRRLQEQGILVRYFDQPLLQNGFRVSVGRPEENDIFLKTLRGLEGKLDE